jgi:mannose/fructose-specific phosphotransferase system component IIA
MVKGLIITHSDLGRELIQSAQTIIGEAEGLSALSNSKLSGEDLQKQISAEVSASEKLILFVDCFGSTLVAAKIASAGRSPIICGVNLPLILAFLTKREKFPLEKLVEILLEDGKRSIDLK